MAAPSSTTPLRTGATGYHQPLIAGLSAADPTVGRGPVLGFGRRHETTRCAAAKPVRFRHSPATVTILVETEPDG